MQKKFNLGKFIRGSLYSNSNITTGPNSEIAITCSPVPTLTGKPKGWRHQPSWPYVTTWGPPHVYLPWYSVINESLLLDMQIQQWSRALPSHADHCRAHLITP